MRGSRDNRRYLKKRGIRFAGKPLGRPKKLTDENREALKRLASQRREEHRQRIPIEGKFGKGKNGYRLNYIRAKRADTSNAWINSILLVMNLLILLRVFYCLWGQWHLLNAITVICGAPVCSIRGRLRQGCRSRASREGFTAYRGSNTPGYIRLSKCHSSLG